MALTASDVKIIVDAESAKASAEIKKLTKDLDKMNKTIASGGKLTKQNTSQMTRSFKSLTAHVSKLAIIYGSFKTLMTGTVLTAQFEQSIQKLGVYSGATAEEIGLLSDKAKELGESTIFSATQVAEGMNEMALAGLSADDQLAGIGDALNLASVGMITLKDATDFAVTSMKTFGLEADDIGDVTDIFAKGATISATTVTQLGQAMTKVGAVANDYNISLEETTALLGVLADGGRRGTEAGTQLKIAMLRLASNPEAKKYLDELGVSMYKMVENADGTTTKVIRPFTEQLAILRDRLKELDAESRNEAMARIFGTEAVASASLLMKNLEKVHENLGKIKDAMQNDFATQSAKLITDTLIGSFKNLTSALEGLAIKIVSEMTPALREMLDGWTETIRGMDEDDIQEFADGLTGLVELITNVTGAFADLAGSTFGFISENKNLLAVLALTVGALKLLRVEMAITLGTALVASTGSIATMTIAIGVLETRLKALFLTLSLSPWGLIILGIAGASMAVAGYIDHLEEANKKANKLAEDDLKRANDLTRYVDQLEASINKETGAIGKSNVERAKMALKINEHIIALIKETEALDKSSLGEKEYAKRKKENQIQLGLFDEALKLIGKSWEDETKAKKKSTDAEIANMSISKKALENFKTYEKALNKKVTASEKAVAKILKAERGLVLEQAKLEKERAKIIEKYADERLQIEENYDKLAYEGDTANLTDYQKYTQDLLRVDEQLAKGREALAKGNIDEASRYYAEAKSLASSFSGQVIEENGKVLVSAEESYEQASRKYKETKQGELAVLEEKRIAELKANKEKLDLVALELKGQRALLQMQNEFIKKLGELGKKANETKADFDKPEYFENINKEFDETIKKFENKSLELQADIDTAQHDKKLDQLKTDKAELEKTDTTLKVDTKEVEDAGKEIGHVKKLTEGSNFLVIDTVDKDGNIIKTMSTVEDLQQKINDDNRNFLVIDTVDKDGNIIKTMSTVEDLQEKVNDENRNFLVIDTTDANGKIDKTKSTVNDLQEELDDSTNNFLVVDTTDATGKIIKTKSTVVDLQEAIEDVEKSKVTIETDNSEVEDLKKEVEDLNETIKEPKEIKVETGDAVEKTEQLVNTINNMTAYVKVSTDASGAVTEVNSLVDWINNQIAYVTVKTVGGKPSFSDGGLVQGLADGGTFTGDGRVAGYDSTDSDSVNAKLTGGEFVFNRESVDAIGVNNLYTAMFSKTLQLPKFADGGLVGESAPSAPSSAGDLGTLTLQIGGRDFNVFSPTDVATNMQKWIDEQGGL